MSTELEKLIQERIRLEQVLEARRKEKLIQREQQEIERLKKAIEKEGGTYELQRSH